MKLHFGTRGEQYAVDARIEGGELVVRDGDGEPRRYDFEFSEDYIELRSGERRWRARVGRRGHEIYLHVDGVTWHLHQVDAQEQEDLAVAAGDPVLRAPMPGRVLEILCSKGDEVRAGAALVRVEAMKMEVDLVAPTAGTIAEIHVVAEQLVEPETLLVTMEPQG